MNKNYLIIITLVLVLQSCASKKNVLYFQNAYNHAIEEITYPSVHVQVNDILNIIVGSQMPETSIPYNIQSLSGGISMNLEVLRLQGYLVAEDGTIDFPILGKIDVVGKTIEGMESEIQRLLKEGGHLLNPTVNARILNSKVTVLGEVRVPGTYSFTEQNITLPQALGYAGDLTINGERKDVLLIREENGIRTINHIDLTNADWFSSPSYYIKSNDVIVVNPNNPKVKSAGFIGNTGTVISVISLLLTSLVLITK